MNEAQFQKAKDEIGMLRGQIGVVSSREETMNTASREPAKSQLKRAIERLLRTQEEAHRSAVELQALYNELPDTLSRQADGALYQLLEREHKDSWRQSLP